MHLYVNTYLCVFLKKIGTIILILLNLNKTVTPTIIYKHALTHIYKQRALRISLISQNK